MSIAYSDRVSCADADALRSVSRDAFGQDYQLEVMLAVADATGSINLSHVAAQLGLQPFNIQNSWKRLIDLKLITMSRREQRTKHYERRDSAAWTWARELAGELWITE